MRDFPAPQPPPANLRRSPAQVFAILVVGAIGITAAGLLIGFALGFWGWKVIR